MGVLETVESPVGPDDFYSLTMPISYLEPPISSIEGHVYYYYLEALNQLSTNSFCKEPDNEYFILGRPHCLYHNYKTQPLLYKVVIGNMSTAIPVMAYLQK